jgi:hypothetical protein
MTNAEALYGMLDGFVGVFSEQGWDGIDRYFVNPEETFKTLLISLTEMSPKLGKELSQLANAAGLRVI